MICDERLRELALLEFITKARAKFDAGAAEHNPKGDRPLARLTPLQLNALAKEECIDQWMYLCAQEVQLFNFSRDPRNPGEPQKTETNQKETNVPQ